MVTCNHGCKDNPFSINLPLMHKLVAGHGITSPVAMKLLGKSEPGNTVHHHKVTDG